MPRFHSLFLFPLAHPAPRQAAYHWRFHLRTLYNQSSCHRLSAAVNNVGRRPLTGSDRGICGTGNAVDEFSRHCGPKFMPSATPILPRHPPRSSRPCTALRCRGTQSPIRFDAPHRRRARRAFFPADRGIGQKGDEIVIAGHSLPPGSRGRRSSPNRPASTSSPGWLLRHLGKFAAGIAGGHGALEDHFRSDWAGCRESRREACAARKEGAGVLWRTKATGKPRAWHRSAPSGSFRKCLPVISARSGSSLAPPSGRQSSCRSTSTSVGIALRSLKSRILETTPIDLTYYRFTEGRVTGRDAEFSTYAGNIPAAFRPDEDIGIGAQGHAIGIGAPRQRGFPHSRNRKKTKPLPASPMTLEAETGPGNGTRRACEWAVNPGVAFLAAKQESGAEISWTAMRVLRNSGRMGLCARSWRNRRKSGSCMQPVPARGRQSPKDGWRRDRCRHIPRRKDILCSPI